MKATTAAYRGLPPEPGRSIVKTGLHAEDHGWTTRSTYTTQPPTVAVRFSKPGCPRVYAVWKDGRFGASYASTAQRLSHGDLMAVLEDPSLLVPEDIEWPFGQPEIVESDAGSA